MDALKDNITKNTEAEVMWGQLICYGDPLKMLYTISLL